MVNKKSGRLAIVMSVLITGLGQMYAGKAARRAAMLMCQIAWALPLPDAANLEAVYWPHADPTGAGGGVFPDLALFGMRCIQVRL